MTKIEWVKDPKTGLQGKTWNPVTGCTKISSGCKNCYAERMARRLAGRCGYPEQPDHFKVTLHPDRLDQPLRWKKPRMVFVNSMSDLFHEDVSFEFVDQIFQTMALAHQHTFQVLTKRPERMLKYMQSKGIKNDVGRQPLAPFQNRALPNIWLGVTCENQETADERIPLLLQIPAVVRFVSCEPLLGPIDLARAYPCGYYCDEAVGHVDHPFYTYQGVTSPGKIDWLIVGGESGPRARPMHPDWARSLRDQATTAGVPFFFKQFGTWKEIQFDKRGRGDILFNPTNGIVKRLPDPFDGNAEEFKHTVAMRLVGKKRAGRILDGCTWDQMPEVIQ